MSRNKVYDVTILKRLLHRVGRQSDTVVVQFGSGEVVGSVGRPWNHSWFRWPSQFLGFSILAAILFRIFQPDPYGLFPNLLDPVFYTGYSIMPRELIASLADDHYFVSRWIAYFPQALFVEMFGLFRGRLVLRMFMWVLAAQLLWRMGDRMGAQRSARALGLVFALTAPLFIRPLLTDYPEYIGVFLHLVAAILLTRESKNWVAVLALGAICGLLIVSNPFNLVHALIYVCIFIWRAAPPFNPGLAVRTAFVFGSSLLGILALGMIYFRLAFGIENIYAPSIEFILRYHPPVSDPHLSMTSDWLGYFAWIYLGPILALCSFLMRRFGWMSDVTGKVAKTLEAVVTSVFLVHVLYELNRGHALESSIYFSSSSGPVLVLMFVVMTSLVPLRKKTIILISTVAIWLFSSYDTKSMQSIVELSGTPLLVVLATMTIGCAISTIKIWRASVVFLCVLILWTQLGGATYTGRTPMGNVNSPRYDLITDKLTVESRRLIVEEIDWFSRTLSQESIPVKAEFISAGEYSQSIIGIYSSHAYGRWHGMDDLNLGASDLNALKTIFLFGSEVPWIIYGPSKNVNLIDDRLKEVLSPREQVFDVSHAGGLNYRAVGFQRPSCRTAHHELPLSLFSSEFTDMKNIDRTASFGVRKRPGFVLYGPYLTLAPGHYKASLTYATTKHVGAAKFEVSTPLREGAVAVELIGTEGEWTTAEIRFRIDQLSGPWEFRVFASEDVEIDIRAVGLQKISC